MTDAADKPDQALELEQRARLAPEHLRSVRLGHGANCSSIGSVVDTLFVTATIGAAVFAAVVAALKSEDIRVVDVRDREQAEDDEPPEKGS